MATPEETREAVQTVAEAAGANEALTDALECAEEAQEAAEEAAAEIAAAAMESERGKRLEGLEQWRNEVNERMAALASAIETQTRMVTEMSAAIAAQTPPVVTVEIPAPPQADQSSIPPASPVPEAAPLATVTVDPVKSESAADPVVPPARKRRFL